MSSDTLHDVELVCALVGKSSNAFSVRVDEAATVETLKQAILQAQRNQFRNVDSSQLELLLAKATRTSDWVEEKGIKTLASTTEYPIKLYAQAKLSASGLSISDIGIRNEVAVAEGKGPVHVLVSIPAAGTVVRRSQAVRSKSAYTRRISDISRSTDPNIVLRFMSLDDDDMVSLAEAMVDRSKVEVLDLQSNKIGDLGAAAIASILDKSNVKQLLLANNNIGEGGAEKLAEALAGNSTLLVLNLHRNPIGNAGAKFIAGALANLEELDLGTAEIHGGGAVELAKAITTNKTLKKLNLMGNDIEGAGVKKLAKALKTNKTLESVVLSKHHVMCWHRWFVLRRDKVKYEHW